jgi:adenosylcobinamide-GDP ribazoletransferase
LGVALGGVFLGVAQLRGGLVAAVATVATSLLVTGAFHEDGLADTADALGGGYSREHTLAILKDSRVGAYGAAAMAMALLGRAALLSVLDVRAPSACVVTECVSRCVPVWMMLILPYASSDQGKSRPVVRVRGVHVVVASATAGGVLVAAVVGGALSVTEGIAIVVAGGVVGVGLGCWFWRRVGGVTGDFLGAAQQASTIAMLAVLAPIRA